MTIFFTADSHFGDHRAINLHGHSHGKLKAMPRQFDVGVGARVGGR